MVDGKIVRSGGPEVALELEESGYAEYQGEEEPAIAGV
jgi:Fe-S cluster assembly ATP-binding protein